MVAASNIHMIRMDFVVIQEACTLVKVKYSKIQNHRNVCFIFIFEGF